MAKVSIIVPIYNAEKYLERCLESIINQTLKDIQIILVNDGSTDNSLSICRKYQAIDERIITINKENGGVSSARNTGIENAQGEFIGFIDPDDWVEPDMYEKLYKQAKQIKADVCMCNYIIEQYKQSIPIIEKIDKEILKGAEITDNIIANMIGDSHLDSGSSTIMGSVWRLIIHRDLVKKHNLRFKVGIHFMEDLLFCIETFLRSRVVGVNRGTFYHYAHNENSAVRSYKWNMYDLQMTVYQEMEKTINENGVYDILKSRLDIRYANMLFDSISNEVKEANKKSLKQKIAFIKTLCKDKKLKEILNKTDTSRYTLRKKLFLNAVKKENAYLLYLYYNVLYIKQTRQNLR